MKSNRIKFDDCKTTETSLADFEKIQNKVADACRAAFVPFMTECGEEHGPTGSLAVAIGLALSLSGCLQAIASAVEMEDEEVKKIFQDVMVATGKTANMITNRYVCRKMGITEEELTAALAKLKADGNSTEDGCWAAFPVEALEQLLDSGFTSFKTDESQAKVDPEQFFRDLFADDEDE